MSRAIESALSRRPLDSHTDPAWPSAPPAVTTTTAAASRSMPPLPRRSQTANELARYAVVAAVALVVDFGLLTASTELLGFHYLLSAALGFTAGVATNYALSTAWVFRTRRLSSRATEVNLFVIIGLVGLAITEGVMWGLTDLAGVHYLVAKAVCTAVLFFWNFGVRKVVLFS